MTDQEKAQRLLDRASRKLNSMDETFLRVVVDISADTPLGPSARDWLDRLCNEFADYLKP